MLPLLVLLLLLVVLVLLVLLLVRLVLVLVLWVVVGSRCLVLYLDKSERSSSGSLLEEVRSILMPVSRLACLILCRRFLRWLLCAAIRRSRGEGLFVAVVVVVVLAKLLALLYGFGLRGLDVVLEYVVLRMTFMKPGGAVELSIVGVDCFVVLQHGKVYCLSVVFLISSSF